MSKTLIKTIQWTLYIMLTVLIVVVVFVPMFFELFLPNSPYINGVRNISQVAGTALGLVSVGLGCFSIYQSNLGSKQTERALTIMSAIENSQRNMDSTLSDLRSSIVFSQRYGSASEWVKDNVHE